MKENLEMFTSLKLLLPCINAYCNVQETALILLSNVDL